MFPKNLEERLAKVCSGNNTALGFLVEKDEQIIEIVRQQSNAARVEWQTVIDNRLAGRCSLEGCSGDDEYENENGSYHEQHIDYVVTRRDDTKRYYDQLLADLDATFKEWRDESATTH